MTTPHRRRPRLTDAQTERRMLDAALALLAEHGVAVALDGPAFEDVVRAADVSRTSAYRRWPTREALFDDVLVELAHGVDVPGAADLVLAAGPAAVAAHRAGLGTPQGRRDLLVELLRLAFAGDLAASAESASFQSFLTLQAAFAGLPSARLRARVVVGLAHAERRMVARGATIVAGAARLLGFRPLGALPADDAAEIVARAVAAATHGYLLAALVAPEQVIASRSLAAFGTPAADWTEPALALTTLVLGFLEPDPDAVLPGPDDLLAGLTALVEQGARAAAAVDADPTPA